MYKTYAEKTDKSFLRFKICLILWLIMVATGLLVAFAVPRDLYLQNARNIEEYNIRWTFRKHHLVAPLYTETSKTTDDFPELPVPKTETSESTDDLPALPFPKTRAVRGGWQPKPIGYQLQKNEIFFLDSEAKPVILNPHIFGTDKWGRDVFLRSLASLPIYLIPSVVSIAIALLLGIFLAISGGGFMRKSIRFLALALVDAIDAFPKYMTILLAVVVIPAKYRNFEVLGVSCYGFYWLSIIIGVLAAPKIAKLIIERIEIFWKREFIQATLAMGVPWKKIALVHILRYNCLPFLFLQIGVLCADVATIEITLNYISGDSKWGHAVTVPHEIWPSWGNMLALAKENLKFWWAYVFPIFVSLVWILTNYVLTYFFNRHLSQQRLKVED